MIEVVLGAECKGCSGTREFGSRDCYYNLEERCYADEIDLMDRQG